MEYCRHVSFSKVGASLRLDCSNVPRGWDRPSSTVGRMSAALSAAGDVLHTADNAALIRPTCCVARPSQCSHCVGTGALHRIRLRPPNCTPCFCADPKSYSRRCCPKALLNITDLFETKANLSNYLVCPSLLDK